MTCSKSHRGNGRICYYTLLRRRLSKTRWGYSSQEGSLLCASPNPQILSAWPQRRGASWREEAGTREWCSSASAGRWGAWWTPHYLLSLSEKLQKPGILGFPAQGEEVVGKCSLVVLAKTRRRKDSSCNIPNFVKVSYLSCAETARNKAGTYG